MKLIVFSAAAVLGLLLAACERSGYSSPGQPGTGPTAGQPSSSGEAGTAAGPTAPEERQEWVRKMESQLEAIDRGIQTLRARAQSAGEESRKALDDAVDQLSQKREIAESKLRDLRSAGARAFNDAREAAESAFRDLSSSLEQAFSRFKE